MTIEEAIQHCEGKAELKEAEAERMLGAKPLARRLNRKTFADDSATDAFYNGLAEKCSACAEECRQLAEWLKILKKARFEYDEAHRIITHPTPDVTYADRNRAQVILDTFRNSLGVME